MKKWVGLHIGSWRIFYMRVRGKLKGLIAKRITKNLQDRTCK